MSTPYSVRVRVVSRLSWLLGVLSMFAALAALAVGGGGGRRVVESVRGSVVTLYGEGVYEFDTILVGAGNRGQDLVILLVEVPVLFLCVRWYRQGTLAAAVALPGVLAFFVYLSASLTFATAQNQLFVLYLAMFAVSVFALVLALSPLDAGAVLTLVAGGLLATLHRSARATSPAQVADVAIRQDRHSLNHHSLNHHSPKRHSVRKGERR